MKHTDYTVAWISALPREQAVALLDEYHDRLPAQRHDTTYLFGRIDVHNVILACLPTMGTNAAARCAARLQSGFPALRFILMVGIGGGAPTRHDIRLGDVVVSVPGKDHRGVVQYDFGTKFQDESLAIRDTQLNRPPDLLLTAVSSLDSKFAQSDTINKLGRCLHDYAEFVAESYPALKDTRRPQTDNLYQTMYRHQDDEKTCKQAGCDLAQVVRRQPRDLPGIPKVHYGLIASGNEVLRDASERDRLAAELDVLCFEMEAAGLMTEIGCLVIRGICDYCDSHKDKVWQAYAAAVAAAYATEILRVIPPLQATPEKNDSPNECLRNLRLTDPRVDKSEILARKDELLLDSCSWIYEDEAFHNWWSANQSPILWLHGDAGKGKTMLMIAICDKISKQLTFANHSTPVAYFFCQSTNPNANTAHAVLRGLIYMLVTERPGLLHYVEKRYNEVGSRLFEGGSSDIFILRSILLDVIQDPSISGAYLIVDALDECDHDLEVLLDIITRDDIGLSSKAKWLLSSRNDPRVRGKLEIGAGRLHTSLELNAEHMAQGVKNFVNFKVDRLASLKNYDQELEHFIRNSLLEKAEDTYLWVSLVCKQLSETMVWRTRAAIAQFPAGLSPLYDRMMQLVNNLPDREAVYYCRRVLRAATIASRPLSFEELVFVAALPENEFKSSTSVRELVSFCGSFLTCRESYIYFVHQSAKDYLDESPMLPLSKPAAHEDVTYRSLDLLLNELKEDLCDLQAPGILLSGIPVSRVQLLVSPRTRYACCYWIEHFSQAATSDGVNIAVLKFFKQALLFWMECLCLLESVPQGIMDLLTLENFIVSHYRGVDLQELRLRISDAFRFISSNRGVIEIAPLQIYTSALVFSPRKSITRRTYLKNIPANLVDLPPMEEGWSFCLQIIDAYSPAIDAVAFSMDGEKVAFACSGTVRVHIAITGQLQSMIEADSRVHRVFFLNNGEKIATQSLDCKTRIWDVITGQLHSITQDYEASVDETLRLNETFTSDRLKFSPNGKMYAVWTPLWTPSNIPLDESAFEVCDTATNQSRFMVDGMEHFGAVKFSFDSGKIVSGDTRGWVTVWDTISGEALTTFQAHSKPVCAVNFSPSTARIATGADDSKIKLWDAATGQHQFTFEGKLSRIILIEFSPDETKIASATLDCIFIWNETTCQTQTILEGHYDFIECLSFSPDGTKIASGARDGTVRIWSAEITPASRSLMRRIDDDNFFVIFSPDSKKVATGSVNGLIRLWDTRTRQLELSHESNVTFIMAMAFSCDSSTLATGSLDGSILILDVTRSVPQLELPGHSAEILALVFLTTHELLSGSKDATIRLWDTTNGQMLSTLNLFEEYSCLFDSGLYLSSCTLPAISRSSVGATSRWDAVQNKLHSILSCVSSIENLDFYEGQLVLQSVRDLAVSPNEEMAAILFRNDTLNVWSIPARQLLLTLEHPHSVRDPLNALVFSTDSKYIAAGSNSQNAVRVWDAQTGELVKFLDGYDGLSALTFSQDDQSFAWGRHRNTAEAKQSPAVVGMPSPYSLDMRLEWVLYKGERFFWLPWNIRPSRDGFFTMSGNVLVLLPPRHKDVIILKFKH